MSDSQTQSVWKPGISAFQCLFFIATAIVPPSKVGIIAAKLLFLSEILKWRTILNLLTAFLPASHQFWQSFIRFLTIYHSLASDKAHTDLNIFFFLFRFTEAPDGWKEIQMAFQLHFLEFISSCAVNIYFILFY